MNYLEVNQATAKALKRQRQNSVFANNWEVSGRLLSTLAIPKDVVVGADESFLGQSKLFPELMKQVNLDDVSITDLILISQAAKAVEDGDSKAAAFVRDTSGGKPVDKKQDVPSNMTDLSDDQIEFLLAHTEVECDEDQDTIR